MTISNNDDDKDNDSASRLFTLISTRSCRLSNADDMVRLGVSHFVTFCMHATPDSEQEIFLICA
jgi:hypothetical protein